LYAIVNIVFRWSESPPMKRGVSQKCLVTESADASLLFLWLCTTSSYYIRVATEETRQKRSVSRNRVRQRPSLLP
jgi:hypothetical protein